jgi:hypothetical protein
MRQILVVLRIKIGDRLLGRYAKTLQALIVQFVGNQNRAIVVERNKTSIEQSVDVNRSIELESRHGLI